MGLSVASNQEVLTDKIDLLLGLLQGSPSHSLTMSTMSPSCSAMGPAHFDAEHWAHGSLLLLSQSTLPHLPAHFPAPLLLDVRVYLALLKGRLELDGLYACLIV